MAIVFNNDIKYSLKYTSAYGLDSVTKSVSGLNIRSSTDESHGPQRGTAVENLINTLQSFTRGTNGNYKWISEDTANIV